MQPIRSSL